MNKHNESSIRWKLNNPEKVREQARKDTRNYRIRHSDGLKKLSKERQQSFEKRITTLRLEKGGKCTMCGYCEEIRILHFHHLRDKKFELSKRGKPINEMREEAEKCILLCPNCHALIHLNPRE